MSPVVRPTRHSIICEAAPNKKADSTAKRARQAEKRRVYNKARKSEVKTRMKKEGCDRGGEYELDGIDWTKVDFEDNQECLDLFEKKPIGLISLLDEDSNFPKATDLTFANKLKQHLSGNPCFKGERGGAFGICHYAGEVFGVFRKKGTKLYEAGLKDEKPLDQWLHC
ncbi:unnamed protein product [Camellia sinensis]